MSDTALPVTDAIRPPEEDDSPKEQEAQTSCESSGGISLKQALAGVGAVAAAISTAGCPPPPFPGDGYPDIPPKELPENLRRLVERVTFGLNAREADLAWDLGYQDYLEYHLDYASIPDDAVDSYLAQFSTLTMSAREIARRPFANPALAAKELFTATAVRAAYSRRQLFERMVEFWTNHFSIFIGGEVQNVLKPVDDRDVIRARGMATFKQLLRASAHSPAMLVFLDNASSTLDEPNQNYARELLELHTLGPDDFAQQDMIEVARCLTGWTANPNIFSGGLGQFQFNAALHDTGAKTVLGFDIPAGGGVEDGERVVEILTEEASVAPVTARFLARKLAVQFWGYDPPEELVGDIAQAYLDTGGDIRAMIRAALQESWLAVAPPKLKRPFHFAMSALRARPSTIQDYDLLGNLLYVMGNQPFFWIPPDGYPDDPDYWGSYLLPRWNFASWLVLQEDGAAYDLVPFDVAASDEDVLAAVDTYFFNGSMETAGEDTLRDYLAADPNNALRRREAVGLAVGAPGFQWY